MILILVYDEKDDDDADNVDDAEHDDDADDDDDNDVGGENKVIVCFNRASSRCSTTPVLRN